MLDEYLPKVSHGASKTHRRYTAGFDAQSDYFMVWRGGRGVPRHHPVYEICVIATFTYLITIYWYDAKITFDRSIDYGIACNGL